MMKKLIRNVGKILLGILSAVLLYVILGVTLPLIPIQEEETSDPKVVDIYILTNGVHTDIVMPVSNSIYDWTIDVSMLDTKSKQTDYQYIAVGWGDKGFYLDTPTWAELKVSTALKAAFWLSESAMHCTFYRTMHEGEDCRKIRVTQEQYLRLVDFVKNKFDRDDKGRTKLIPTNAVYGDHDVFYDARGSYSFLQTCNTWANDALKVAGQRAALWTPTDVGIFRHYK